MKPILTEYDEDAEEFVEKLPKNEQAAMRAVLDRFYKQHHPKKPDSKKEKAMSMVLSRTLARLGLKTTT